MVVIGIVAVLSVIAVVAYRKIVNSSHVSEATHLVSAIRTAQEAYHAETQIYANVSTSLQGDPYPNASPAFGTKTGWGAGCNSNCNNSPTWTDLNVHVDGPVMFGYTTVSGVAGQPTTPASVKVNGVTAAFPSKPTNDWYIIGATCDVDGSGANNWNSNNTNVYASSFTNDVWIDNDGQ
jgi:Tfp pilus assembly major pilin PilA